MTTVLWVLGIAVALVATHAFVYWRGAVAGEARARAQAKELMEWAEREVKELGTEAAESIRLWIYRLKKRFGL